MKKPLIYLGIAVVFAIVVIAIENPFGPRLGDSDANYLLKDYNSKDVEFVEVEQLIDGAKLKREGNTWIVSEIVTPLKKELYEKDKKDVPVQEWKTADADRINTALGVMSGLERGSLVSTNPDNQRGYLVGPEGLKVKAIDKDKKVIFDIVIGKNGPDFTSNYIKEAGRNDVRLVPRNLIGIFSPRASDWELKEEKPADAQADQEGQR
jgi:hypothetical protein